MFISEEQATRRLNHESNLANLLRRAPQVPTEEQTETQNEAFIPEIVEETINAPGRTVGKKSLTPDTLTEIAIRARLGERQQTLANEYGITQEHVSQIKNGKAKSVNEESVGVAIKEVRDIALERLMKSLNLLTDDKLSGCSAKDLSVIASNMGRVVEKTLPKSELADQINLVIYAPEMRQEKAYPVIEI